eukprot:4042716-Pleurochrysis_carterae.AAC.1
MARAGAAVGADAAERLRLADIRQANQRTAYAVRNSSALRLPSVRVRGRMTAVLSSSGAHRRRAQRYPHSSLRRVPLGMPRVCASADSRQMRS